MDDPVANRCIDRVQRRAVAAAFDWIERERRAGARRVLDYGCGPGRWVPFFADRGWSYSGVDLSHAMVAMAAQHHPGHDLRVLAGDRIPHADGAFDAVCSIAVIHHNPYDEQGRILGELARVVRSGGHLMLFEGLGPRAAAGSVESPRQLGDWIALGVSHGLVPRWHRAARYRALGDLAARFRRRGSSPRQEDMLSRLLDRVDAVVDPYLTGLLPVRFCTRAAMVFLKPD